MKSTPDNLNRFKKENPNKPKLETTIKSINGKIVDSYEGISDSNTKKKVPIHTKTQINLNTLV